LVAHLPSTHKEQTMKRVTQMKKAVLVAIAGTALVALTSPAEAADITVINASSDLIHPYFKSNCWDPAQIATPGPDEWVYFGGIGSNSQFTWNTFEVLLKAKCRNPRVSFTFALDGEAPPTGHVPKHRTVKLDFDATVPVYTISLGNKPVVTSVTPDEDNDRDD
jgi:hypothetical protein